MQLCELPRNKASSLAFESSRMRHCVFGHGDKLLISRSSPGFLKRYTQRRKIESIGRFDFTGFLSMQNSFGMTPLSE